MRKTKVTRWRFLKDDDGHTYLIPVGEEHIFERWLAAGPYWGKDYNDCVIGCNLSCYTFIDPREDQ